MPTLFPANEAPRLALGAPGIRRITVRTDKNPYPAEMPQLQYRMVSDDGGVWFEVGFTALGQMNGNAAAGFTMGTTLMELQQSLDLVTWNMGKFEPAPVPEIDNGDGTFTYWSRSTVPRLWKYVTIDETATSTRYGKSITAIHLFKVLIALPNYPYDMPSEAAQLQTDLIAAGYAGATVTSTAANISVKVTNHYWDGISDRQDDLPVTLSGSDVTMVNDINGANITLPGYPYAMPAQRATLQSDLVAAGQTGANVMLFGDPWTVFIPDRNTILGQREFVLTITPGDPFTQYNMFGVSSTNNNNTVEGTFSNVRATTGLAPLEEAGKQFARLRVQRDPKPQYIRRNIPSTR